MAIRLTRDNGFTVHTAGREVEVIVEPAPRKAFLDQEIDIRDMSVNPSSANFMVGEEMRWIAYGANKLVIEFRGEVVSIDEAGKKPARSIPGERGPGGTMVATAFALVPGTHQYAVEVGVDGGKTFRDSHCPTATIHK